MFNVKIKHLNSFFHFIYLCFAFIKIIYILNLINNEFFIFLYFFHFFHLQLNHSLSSLLRKKLIKKKLRKYIIKTCKCNKNKISD